MEERNPEKYKLSDFTPFTGRLRYNDRNPDKEESIKSRILLAWNTIFIFSTATTIVLGCYVYNHPEKVNQIIKDITKLF